jgi:hypothetical protein
MSSYSEYYRQRLEAQRIRLQILDANPQIHTSNITGKKRKYEEAIGYPNDYLVVQEPETFISPWKGINWIDAYLENLDKEKNKK